MNKILTAMSAVVITGTFTACKNGLETQGNVIEKPEVQVVDGKITPEVLEAFGRAAPCLAA